MTAQERYDQMRAEGLSHNLAEMFSLQSPPQIAGTDSVFLQGHCNGNQFEGQEYAGDFYKAEAKAAGVDTSGAIYLGGLAAYPGDPKAWVRSRGDVRRVCVERGWNCDGAVKVKGAEADGPPPHVPLAEDIVDHHTANVLAHVPESERPHIDIQDLREQVKEHYTPPWNR